MLAPCPQSTTLSFTDPIHHDDLLHHTPHPHPPTLPPLYCPQNQRYLIYSIIFLCISHGYSFPTQPLFIFLTAIGMGLHFFIYLSLLLIPHPLIFLIFHPTTFIPLPPFCPTQLAFPAACSAYKPPCRVPVIIITNEDPWIGVETSDLTPPSVHL